MSYTPTPDWREGLEKTLDRLESVHLDLAIAGVNHFGLSLPQREYPPHPAAPVANAPVIGRPASQTG